MPIESSKDEKGLVKMLTLSVRSIMLYLMVSLNFYNHIAVTWTV